MGITGLLPYLSQATKQCHISEFRGGTVAVDSYCLLHKGCNACAEQLARGEDNQMYVNYCIKYVKLLLSYDIHPIMVFDGRNLPAKAETEAKRRESRKKAKQRAAELLKLGKTEEARTYLKQCIDVTPKMAHNLIKACRELKVDCIVAPYESDAQLAFFNIKGIAECVITEDSDLILFGCKKVLYKLDLSGEGRLVEADKIPIAMKMRPDQFTFDKFRYMCILSGCDYVSSLSGIGLKKAERFLKLTAETNPEVFLDRIPRYLKMNHLEVTEEYKKNVLIANATFLHQVVFDPHKKKLVHLIEPEIAGTNPDYLINAGDKFDNDKAFQVALGNANPYNFEPFDNWTPLDLPKYSIWSTVYQKRLSRRQEKQNILKAKQEAITVNTEIIELHDSGAQRRESQDDYLLDEEILRYTSQYRTHNQEVKTEETKEDHKDDITIKPKVSPVLARNPFLRKKRLSKLPETFTYGSGVVKSRFFCLPASSTSKTEDSDSKNASLEEQSSISQESTVTLEVSVATEEVLKARENTDEAACKKRLFEETVVVDIQQEEKVEIIDIDLVKDELEKTSSISAKENQETKKRKLGPCRTMGLKKKSAGQQTLHDFFGKLKKSD